MINEARTLLLNKAGAGRPAPSFYFEEYIPPDFVPVSFTPVTARLYDLLIGNLADDAFANARVWDILRAIHSTEFAKYITDLDPRVTYLHNRNELVTRNSLTVVGSNAAARGVVIYPIGEASASQSQPRSYFNWQVEAVTPSVVKVTDMAFQNNSTETVVGGSDELSDPIKLPNQKSLQIRIGAYPLPNGALWQLTAFVPPAFGLVDVLASLDANRAQFEEALFGDLKVEPYYTFKQLFDKHAEVNYRLAGVVLAQIYRMEEERLRNG